MCETTSQNTYNIKYMLHFVHTVYLYVCVSYNFQNKHQLFINRLFYLMERQWEDTWLLEC